MDHNSLKSSKKCACSSSGSVASATSSSSRSSSGTIGKYGFRTVHLKRQPGIYVESNGRPNEKFYAGLRPNSFGFSFRGGREFGTGFFVSAVENDSEAQAKGLKVGDQIVRINGLSVEDATHQEVLQLAQSHHQITLTVKSVGIIPVKDKSEDPLTWKIVDNGIDESLALSCDVDRILIEIPENSQLGCGICKGPDWRPGIFIQYTKPNSLARRCGLQPGDQILQCNRISFLQIDFTYAVSVLKNVRTLDLVIKKGSGIDLFPGESSGYSSSSSVADEAVGQPPSHSKRLSIVAEESDERHQRKQCHCKSSRNTLKSSASIDSVFERFPNENGSSSYRERSKSIEILTDSNFKKSVTFKNHEKVSRTFLNVTNNKGRDGCRCVVGSQTVIKIESNDVRDVETNPSMSGSEEPSETGRISVEVHRSDEKLPDKVPIEKSPSSSSFSSGGSLSSAISQEIQRRKERRLKGASLPRPDKNELLKPADKQQRHQHDMLIAELKKKQNFEDKTSTVSTQTSPESKFPPTRTRQRPATVVPLKPNSEIVLGTETEPKRMLTTFKPLKSPEDSPPACPTPDYYSDNSLTDQSIETSHTVKTSILKFEEKNKTSQKTVTFGQNSTKEITPIKNAVRKVEMTTPKNSVIVIEKKPQDLVEMQSIESYDLTEPKQLPPKPPPTYFQPPSRETAANASVEPKRRTTVIKITEYPTQKRREPVRFDFLNQNNEKEFETELASTLSRSNLKNKTDAFAIKQVENKPNAGAKQMNGFRPAVIVPTENQISNVKKALKTFEKNTSNTVLLKIPKRN